MRSVRVSAMVSSSCHSDLEFRLGQQVRIVHGALAGKLAIYSGMKSSERVEILLAMLGAQQRVILPMSDIARP